MIAAVVVVADEICDACRDIKELLPETRVLMLTASTEEDTVIEAVATGATATCRGLGA